MPRFAAAGVNSAESSQPGKLGAQLRYEALIVVIITKLEAAHRQLVTAIRMYFEDDDIAAIHTLACAAREIYEKHCKAQGVERMFDYVAVANPERSQKELWDILNGPRNWLKHPEASMDLAATLELNDGMNATMLFYACHDCAMLCKADQPPEVQAFNLWFLATQFPREAQGQQDAVRAAEIRALIESSYPGLREAPLAEQKRVGRVMVTEARRLAA